IVDQSPRAGLLKDQHGLLTGALEFSERTAGEVAVPRAGLTVVSIDTTPAQVERVVARTGFSRYPVTDDAEEIIGYLHLKDVLYADEAEYHRPVPSKRIRALVTVHPEDEVEDVLAAMQGSGAHLARVVDGAGVSGVVFLEDVLEELVGQVSDESTRR
ncbi:MAG: CBS domain-containing protein, partial [Angustibacter sp.]